MKQVMIFGSTGSVGRNVLSVLAANPKQFKVLGLSAHNDIKTLRRQIKEFHPRYVCVRNEQKARELAARLEGGVRLFGGETGLEEFACIASDISFMAISGISSLKPLLANLAHTKRVALANKESIVTAGRLVFQRARECNTEILPVDSEINALFQLLDARHPGPGADSQFRRVYLTASGGALASYRKKDLSRLTQRQVLAHPTWKMGKRITVDSTTMVNKGFEVVETHSFFGIPYDNISIVLHKESAVHALVECNDNSLFACIYPPDMRMPIAHALYYPQRFSESAHTNFKREVSFSFSPLERSRYPLLELVLAAAKRQDNSLVALNACDEVSIGYFLQKKIKFIDIPKIMSRLFQQCPSAKVSSLEDVFYWDNWARQKTEEYVAKLWKQ